MRRLPIVLAALMGAALVVVPGAASSHTDAGADRVHAPHARPLRASHPDWLALWSEWVQEIPVPENPMSPDSPRNCEVHGGVALMGFRGVTGCTVPAGTAVGFSFLAWECSTAEGNGRTFEKLRRCAVRKFARNFGPDVLKVRVRVDGERLARPRRWTFTSTPSVVELPADNLWGAPAGPTKSMTRGLFYVVKPLPPGGHLVRARVRDRDTGELIVSFAYRFTVVG